MQNLRPSNVAASSRRRMALVLMGGGARTAYQAGVLHGISSLLDLSASRPQRSPFSVLVGTSAGALNAAFLASATMRWPEGPLMLAEFWRGVRSELVYQVKALKVARGGAKWIALLTLGWLIRAQPRSFLDNTPLVDTLHRIINLPRIDEALERHELGALAVTASSYATGLHWTFCQTMNPASPHDPRWQRPGRRVSFEPITIEHLVASSSIPFLFPATPLWVDGRREYFGDGSMRQTSPLSPAVHLGADRILVIGAGRASGLAGVTPLPSSRSPDGYPTLAHIAGHALASVFQDTVESDVERMRRMNDALTQLPAGSRRGLPLRKVEVLSIQPSRSLDEVALEHVDALPRAVRSLLGALGGTTGAGAALASYLLFERPYADALMALGEQDAYARKEDILDFFIGAEGRQ